MKRHLSSSSLLLSAWVIAAGACAAPPDEPDSTDSAVTSGSECSLVSGGCPERYSNPEDGFKYGSIDNDKFLTGVPYWVFRALPDICPEMLPEDGFDGLGMFQEPGHDRPVGWSKRKLELSDERMNFNCGLCHTSTVRAAPDAKRVPYLGGSAQRLDVERLSRFLVDCIASDAFTVDNLLSAIDKHVGADGRAPLSLVERATYAAFAPGGRFAARSQQRAVNGLWRSPEWGPGRADPFNTLKARVLGLDISHSHIGATKMPVIWNGLLREQKVIPGHWDGTIQSLNERNLAAAAILGASPITDELAARIRGWTDPMKPPAYPFPIDRALATQGADVYRAECASCHDYDKTAGTRMGTVIPLDEIGTDPERSLLVDAFLTDKKTTGELGGYTFKTWRDTDGYLAGPIDGAWLRAPYLHNGSVPTLRDLLEPASERPKTFFKGYDVYDPANLGFVSSVPSEGRHRFFAFDTTLPGNSNAGHEYGTTLSPPEKDALLEYLKTL